MRADAEESKGEEGEGKKGVVPLKAHQLMVSSFNVEQTYAKKKVEGRGSGPLPLPSLARPHPYLDLVGVILEYLDCAAHFI